MRGLLWKDFRLNRGLLLLGALGLVGVYLVGVAVEVSASWPAFPTAKAWADGLCSYGHLALGLTPFVAALLGGNAIASERADRSAHFLAYLPPTKAQVLASKFAVATGALAVIWAVNWVAVYAIAPLINPEPYDFLYMTGTPSAALAGCVATFGVGWLGSAWREKPTVPVLMALAFPFALGYALFTVAAASGLSRFEVAGWAGTVGAGIGVAAFAAGTRYYLRRVEP